MNNMKILCTTNVCGRYEILNIAINKLINEKYDKLIILGNTFGKSERFVNDYVRCVNIISAAITRYGDKIIVIRGNEDEQYFRIYYEDFRCLGFKPEIHSSLHSFLFRDNKFYKFAYGIKNHLFTYAGVTHNWAVQNSTTLHSWAKRMNLDITNTEHFSKILQQIGESSDSATLFSENGPFWCEAKDIIDSGPLVSFNHVTGNEKVSNFYRIHSFEDNKIYKDTSVTFINKKSNFFTLNID